MTHARPTPFRSRLTLEALEWRDQPSGLGLEPPTGTQPVLVALAAVPVNKAPEIVDFESAEIGNGHFLITGRVVDETPGGRTVTFGGAVAQLTGRTVVTDEDGTFSITVRIKTDGTEGGTVSAVTTDGELKSKEVLTHLSATPTP
ncbi:hypothetical protein GobsT_07710 [Gemmata obscuriglobus]|uniref:Uncharacterized protein n=1 Tax=Gemmata obscuriglobus TaxID=114 RepID=A0A2Z3HCL1_9BACT|nr:hypothetical protein [Gemmata obscuriglobus]AWM40695.1 hypothetical protein C1280_29395 [Gemmata obscuriglobus]QEG26036.1 hypothetical protein GobsT_07710 [Gemmata obscuriglobus]VTS00391.1 unnamed protein product [Gemmata obscuriglobus UQM 2246]